MAVFFCAIIAVPFIMDSSVVIGQQPYSWFDSLSGNGFRADPSRAGSSPYTGIVLNHLQDVRERKRQIAKRAHVCYTNYTTYTSCK